MHYVRSQACRLQIEHVVNKCRQDSRLTQQEAEAELHRLASHQDAAVFRGLVDSASRTLTHYMLYPLVLTGPWPFVTSDKIMCASTVESEQRGNLCMVPYLSIRRAVPHVRRPRRTDTGAHRRSETANPDVIGFAKLPEAQWLRCQAPSPQEGSEEFVNTLNRMMVQGSAELFASDRDAIDSALRIAELPTGYRYQPTYGK